MAVAVQSPTDAIDEELRLLTDRLLAEEQKGNVGEAAWTRILIDDALERRHAAAA